MKVGEMRPHAGFSSHRDATAFFRNHKESVTESGPKRGKSKVLEHRSNDYRRLGNEDHLQAAEYREAAKAHRRVDDPAAAKKAAEADEYATSLTARAESRIRRSDALYRTAMESKTIKDRIKQGGLHFFVGANTLSLVVGLLCTPMQSKQLDQINENIKRLARDSKHDRKIELLQMPNLPPPLSYIV